MKNHEYMLYCTPWTQSCKEKKAVNPPFKVFLLLLLSHSTSILLHISRKKYTLY